jgi:hypothetical protein
MIKPIIIRTITQGKKLSNGVKKNLIYEFQIYSLVKISVNIFYLLTKCKDLLQNPNFMDMSPDSVMICYTGNM